MDEGQEKKISTVLTVLLLLIAVLNDGAQIVVDFLSAIVVGLPAGFIMEVINFLVTGFLLLVFFFVDGASGPALIFGAGSLVQFIGIPGRTLTVFFAIRAANKPKSITGKIVGAAGALEGGELGEAEELAAAAQTTETAATAAGTAATAAEEAAAAGAEGAAVTGEAGAAGAAGEGAEAGKGAAQGKDVSDEALGGQPETMDKLNKDLTGESSYESGEQPQESAGEEEEAAFEEQLQESESTKKLREAFTKAQKVRQDLQKLKSPQQATDTGGEDGQDQDALGEAA